MSVLTIYGRIYAGSMKEALRGIGKSPWTLLLPMGMAVALYFAAGLVAGMGFIGGILLALALDALFSSYLYFVSQIVSHQRVSVQEIGQSIRAYFWSVLNLMFVFFIARFALGLVLRGMPQGGLIYAGLILVSVIALNAAPEVIYQERTYGGLQTIRASWDFLKDNWIEWFVPNVPLLLGVAFITVLTTQAPGQWGLILPAVIGGAALHVVMTFRGFLYRELSGSSHRQRMFRHRNA